jgi:hypothetical protein
VTQLAVLSECEEKRVFNKFVESTVIIRILQLKDYREQIIDGQVTEKAYYAVRLKIGKKEKITKKIKRRRFVLGVRDSLK